MISIRKRNNLYEYRFEAGKVNEKRKQISKSGFKTKNEAFIAGQKAYDEFINGGSITECNITKKNIRTYNWHKEDYYNFIYSLYNKYKNNKTNRLL